MRRIMVITLGFIATTFVACNGGGGGAAGTGASGSGTAATLPPPDTSAVSKATNDEPGTVPSTEGEGFVKLNSHDEASRTTITLKGQSD